MSNHFALHVNLLYFRHDVFFSGKVWYGTGTVQTDVLSIKFGTVSFRLACNKIIIFFSCFRLQNRFWRRVWSPVRYQDLFF
jgi:hypothetical protein